MIACLIFVVINKVADGNDDLSMASDSRRGVLYLYSTVPVLTLRFYFSDTHENNQTTTFFDSLSHTQLYIGICLNTSHAYRSKSRHQQTVDGLNKYVKTFFNMVK